MAAAPASAAFSEGFEKGDLNAWSGVTGKPRVQAKAAASGRRSLKSSRLAQPSYVRHDVAGAAVLNVSFRYRAADPAGTLSPSRPRVLLQMPANRIALEDVGGRLVLRVAGRRSSVAGRLQRGWSRVAVRLDSGQGVVRARLAGGAWTSQRAALAAETGLLLGDLDARSNGPAYFDDVAIDARGPDGGPLPVGAGTPGAGDPPATTTPDPPAPAPATPRLFAADSFWNAPLGADAAIDPASDTLVARLMGEVNRVAAVRDGPWMAARQYSTPIYVVGANQPTVRVKLDTADQAKMQAAFSAVPIPENAHQAQGTDGHMTIWQPSTDMMWEFWVASKQADGWHAAWGGAMRNVSQSPGYYSKDSWPGSETWWGASATSLPIAGGTVTIEELRRARIDHALALALPNLRSKVFSWPAQRTDGTSADDSAIPAGARFRLDPALNLDSLKLNPFVRTLAEAAQRYGVVVRDTAPSVQFYGEDPAQYGKNPYADVIGPQYPNEIDKLLRTFPWEHLQVLQMSLKQQP
ncbi:MAG: hypothetical protein QOE06_548 [Thermoleophilaceae bacterium]|jgi:hypothetical protein|nr:hypothetical protein [Thermoleophilaceae bacterium]